MNSWVDWASLAKVLLVGLLGGVGIVVLFSLGLVSLAGTENRGRTALVAGRAAAVTCFALVILAIGLGLYVIVAD